MGPTNAINSVNQQKQHGSLLDECSLASDTHNTVHTDCVQTQQRGIII